MADPVVVAQLVVNAIGQSLGMFAWVCVGAAFLGSVMGNIAMDAVYYGAEKFRQRREREEA